MKTNNDSMEKTRNLQKKLSNGIPKSDTLLSDFTLAPLLAPLAPQVVFLLKKNQPKCSKGGPKVASMTPKEVPKWLKWVPGSG